MFNKRIRDRICDTEQKLAAAESTEEFMNDMVQFYKDFGVGKLGLHIRHSVGHDENGEMWRSSRSPVLPMCIWKTWSAMRSPRKN